MTTKTQTKEKVRAVFLTFLMVMSVFTLSVSFAGAAAAANAGNAASVTAEAMDTTNASATSNVTVVQEANSDTAAGEVAIEILGANDQTAASFDSSDPTTVGNGDGLDNIVQDGNETTFVVNSSEFTNDFQLGDGTVEADGQSGGNTGANADVSTAVALNGLDVTSTSGPRVAANNTDVEYSVTVNNTGSQSLTQDVSLVVTDDNSTLDPTDSNTYNQLETNSSVTVAPNENKTISFSTINTANLTGANENINDYQISGLTQGSPIGASAADLKVGSSSTGSVTVSVVDDTSARKGGVDVSLFVERDFDNNIELAIREGTTNQNGEVTFSGLAVGTDNENPVRYVARAGANQPDLSSTTTTLSLFETTQTSDSSTVVTERLVQPERIEVTPDSDSAVADGSDQVTFTATVFGGIDGIPDSSDDRPIEGAEVRITNDGESLTFDPQNVNNGEFVDTTNADGEVTFNVSSDVVQTVNFDVEAGDGSPALTETVEGEFVLSGEGTLAGTVNNEATTNPIENASVRVVNADDYETNENQTRIDISTDELDEDDDTVFVRLVDNDTNSIINNDDYDLRRSEDDDGTNVRKIQRLNESDNAVGQGYALIDSDGDGIIQFNHARIEDEDYYAQVSFDAENSSARSGVVDVGTEDFVNITNIDGSENTVGGTDIVGSDPVVFEPTANLTLAAAEELSETTDTPNSPGANYVDSPGFVNSDGFDTEGTTDNGRFVLTRLPSNFQDGTQYVAIATATGFSTDFADVTVREDGQLSFEEDQGSNEFFLEPVEVDPDGVDIKQIGTREDSNSTLVEFPDQTDDTFQEVSRDGETTDVFTVNTTAEGEPVNATATVSFDATAVDGEFVSVASGDFVSIDNASNTATLYTGTDGQAEVQYQADSNSNTLDTQKTAVLETDSGVTDSSNVTFVGVINSKSAEVSGIVTDSQNQPVQSVVFTSELTVGGNDFTVEPAAEDLSEFTVSRLDAGTVTESATISRSQAENYNFNVDINGDPVFTGVNVDSSVSPGLTLVTNSTSGAAESSSYTLPRVPAVEDSTNDAAVTAVSQASIQTAGSLSDLEDGTSVTTRTEVNRTSTANIEIAGAAGAQFAVTNVTASPANASQGETVTVEATVENQGAVTAPTDVTYSFGDSVATATEQSSTTTAPIVSGETDTIQFSLDTSSFDAGDFVHVIETSDDTGTADQSIETSNNTSGNVDSYVNDTTGVVEDDGLNNAISDYLSPDTDLSDEELNDIISSYLSGEPIGEQ